MQVPDHLRHIFDSPTLGAVPAPIVGASLDGLIIYWNDAASDLLGCRPDEVVGQTLDGAMARQPPHLPVADLMRIARQGRPGRTELTMRRRDGGHVPIAASLAPLLDSSGRQIAVLGVLSDRSDIVATLAALATERSRTQQASEAASASRQLYESLAESLPGGLIRLLDTDLCFVLSAGEELTALGQTHDALAGQPLTAAYPAPTAVLVADHYRRALAGERVEFELEVSGRPYLVRAVATRDASGRVTGVLALHVNISELRTAREVQLASVTARRDLNRELEARVRARTEALDRLNARLADEIARHQRTIALLEASERSAVELIERAPVSIAVLQPDGTVHSVNQRSRELFGWRPGTITGRSFASLILDPLARTAVEAFLAGTLPVPAGGFDCTLAGADGRAVAVDLRTVRVDRTGQPVILVVLNDVTARRRLEADLRQAQRMEAVGTMAGGISHDFNNLLTTVLGHCGLLMEDSAPGSPASRSLEAIQHAAERGAALTKQLLAFSRRQVLEPTAIDLDAVVADATRLFRRVIGEHISLVTPPAVDLPAIWADRTQVEQVLVNLVVNARDAMPLGGVLTIETGATRLDADFCATQPEARPGPFAYLRVRDTGTGIPFDLLPRIFEPFFTTKEEGRGTGLGLSTVYGITRQSGGALTVESSPGEGSTFTVYLPVAAAGMPASGRRLHVAPASASHQGHGTILVVEDEPAVRLLVRAVLEGRGYRVVDAATTAEAAPLVEGVRLVISDTVLPGEGGPAFVRRLRETRPDLPVILMSGYADEMLSELGMDARVGLFLAKPFDASQLIAKVREALALETS